MGMISPKRTTMLLVLGLAALGAAPPVRPTVSASPDAKSAAEDAKMFPDGRHYDFGKAKAGTIVQHTFRVVNTSDVPLQLISALVQSGCGNGSPLNVTLPSHKDGMLLPNEEASFDIRVNTSRFKGTRTMRWDLATQRVKGTRTFTFSVTGTSDRSP